MRKLIALFGALMLVFVACGDSGGGDSCESIADDAVDLVQAALDDIADLSIADLQNLGDEPPESFQELERQADDLQTKADGAGCSDEEMETLVNARLGSLTADGAVAELVLEQIQSEGLFGE